MPWIPIFFKKMERKLMVAQLSFFFFMVPPVSFLSFSVENDKLFEHGHPHFSSFLSFSFPLGKGILAKRREMIFHYEKET